MCISGHFIEVLHHFLTRGLQVLQLQLHDSGHRYPHGRRRHCRPRAAEHADQPLPKYSSDISEFSSDVSEYAIGIYDSEVRISDVQSKLPEKKSEITIQSEIPTFVRS